MAQSPFSCHPELEGKIAPPLSSFFRSFNVASFFDSKPELRWVLAHLHTDEARERLRHRFFANYAGGDLWVFAYGSLMWDPAFQFTEVRRASVSGYARQFLLKDIYGGRGTKDTPGMMAALDQGEHCEGLAFRIAEADIDVESEILWRREMIGHGYIPTFVTTLIGGQPVRALTFVANHEAETICPDITREEQVHYIATGSGFLGTSKEYLANIVSQFLALGIVDEHCSALLLEVEAYQAAR